MGATLATFQQSGKTPVAKERFKISQRDSAKIGSPTFKKKLAMPSGPDPIEDLNLPKIFSTRRMSTGEKWNFEFSLSTEYSSAKSGFGRAGILSLSFLLVSQKNHSGIQRWTHCKVLFSHQ